MKILLVCGAGASTSYLVMKMLKAAKAQNKDYEIWAIAQTALKYEIDKADVVMLGPQITYMFPEIKALADSKGIPAAVIKPQDYGMCDADKVIAAAEQLVEDYKKTK